MSTFAAVDLGASSGRVILGHVEAGDGGPRVRLEQVARFPNTPRDDGGTLRWDLTRLYRHILAGLREAGERGRVDAIGIDTWAVDYGLLDVDGALLAEPAHYRDGRNALAVPAVHAVLPPEELYAITGLQHQPFNTVFQLAAERDGPLWDRARRLLLVPDLLGYWLTGEQVMELTNASTTALLDVVCRRPAPEILSRLGIDLGLLARVVEPGTVIGTLTAAVQEATGLGPVPVIAVGSHDTASAVVGVPARGADFAYISCGTWSLVGVEVDAPVLTPESRAANFTNELGVDGTVRYLRNVMGLWLLQESLRTWQVAGGSLDLAGLLTAARAAESRRTLIDVDDPEFLPPGDMPARIADHARRRSLAVPLTPPQVVRAILDSLALAHRRAVRDAERLSGRTVSVVHIVGGGSRNELLCQLTADSTGLPVLAGPEEATALGNVLVQARATGVLTGDLAALRAVGARGQDLTTYAPTLDADVSRAWVDAERRIGSYAVGHGAP